MPACVAGAILLTGCADDDPTSVGAVLVDPAELATFEVVLEAEQFLDHGAAFDGYTRPALAPFVLIAEQAGGVLDAHGLVRFDPGTANVRYRDDSGDLQTDDTPEFIGGSLVVEIDTAVSTFEGSVPVILYRVAQSWDEGTAGWTLRVDTAGQQSWTEPGGTTGAVIDSAVLVPEADSVMFAVDSQTVALWADKSGGNGALLTAAEAGIRLFATGFRLRLRARPSEAPRDTVVTADISAGEETFIFSPQPDEPGNVLRVGGTPAWRSFLRFRDRLDTITVAVPFEDETVRVRLSEATLNFAALELAPEPVSEAYRPTRSILFMPHLVNESELIPLARSPVGSQLTPAQAVPATVFADSDGAAARVELPLTSFFDSMLQPPSGEDGEGDGMRTVVLLPTSDSFGFGAFQLAGEAAPRLRLVLTVVKGGDS